MNQIYSTQNNRMALTVYEHLNRTRAWKGLDKPSPVLRFELTPKVQLSPGRYSLDRTATLGHNLSLDKARLLFFDLAHSNFNEDYQVVFRNDNGHKVGKIGHLASMLTATYRTYTGNNPARIVLEVWEGPGAWDHKAGWAYPLNKEQHALALMLDIVDARQMALAALEFIQTWQTVKLLKEWGVISEPVVTEPQQLTLLEAV